MGFLQLWSEFDMIVGCERILSHAAQTSLPSVSSQTSGILWPDEVRLPCRGCIGEWSSATGISRTTGKQDLFHDVTTILAV